MGVAEAEMREALDHIDWTSYGAAATDIPGYLLALFSNQPDKIQDALQYLDWSLCHQHVGIDTSLQPAFPFLVQALPLLQGVELDMLLDLFWGIADVTNPRDRLQPIRILDLSWTKIPDPSQAPNREFYKTVRQALLVERACFEPYLLHPDDDIFELALLIIGNFKETPELTFACLEHVLAKEANHWRRASLYSALCGLTFPRKTAFLLERFLGESDELVRLVVAGQLAYELQNASPPLVIDYLAEELLGACPQRLLAAYERVACVDGYYESLGIALAKSRPALYNPILEAYVQFAATHQRYSWNYYSEMLLAFALCWNGSAQVAHLTPWQVRAIETVADHVWQGRNTYDGSLAFARFLLPYGREKIDQFLAQHRGGTEEQR